MFKDKLQKDVEGEGFNSSGTEGLQRQRNQFTTLRNFSGTRGLLEEENMHEVKVTVWTGGQDSKCHGDGFEGWQQNSLDSLQR
jgi:hypothetical protein